MEERREFGREIVETYRQPDCREVVEVYSRPLPGTGVAQTEETAVRKKRKKGLWIFLICFALVLVAAGTAFLIHWNRERNQTAGELPGRTDVQEISIPEFPTGQGVVLPIEKEPGDVLTIQEMKSITQRLEGRLSCKLESHKYKAEEINL